MGNALHRIQCDVGICFLIGLLPEIRQCLGKDGKGILQSCPFRFRIADDSFQLLHDSGSLIVITHFPVLLPELTVQIGIPYLCHSQHINALARQRNGACLKTAHSSVYLHAHRIQPLPGITLGLHVRNVVSYNIDSLLIHHQASFGCFQPHECRSHPLCPCFLYMLQPYLTTAIFSY